MATKILTAKEKADKDRFAKRVGKILKEEREKAGLTQERLADKADFHRTYIGFIEQGVYSPNLYTLSKLAKALNIKLSQFLKSLD
ncbi:MAG: helix-turn-helix transcriptional regulator [Patescibacteria group bacterium]